MPDFNERQKQAITWEKGPALILAGPGSGKTTVITHRIRHLIKQQSIEPSSILVITFSKAAALEMQQRFCQLMENEYQPVVFGTFHAISFHILKNYYHYSNSDILTSFQKRKYLEQIMLRYFPDTSCDYDTLDSVLHKIAARKNGTVIIDSDMLSREIFEKIYLEYNHFIHENRKIDFEDMQLLCYQLFLEHTDIKREYQQKYTHVLVDEYQDINSLQNKIVNILTEESGNLFVVGDDDQSIYGFRGAKPGIMLRFMEEHQNAGCIHLEHNYRSDKNIILFADEIIRQNQNRYDKIFQAARPGLNPVIMRSFADKETEYQRLVKELKERTDTGAAGSTACLFRTNGDASYLAECLLKEQIPFIMKEKPYNPYEHFIFRDIHHYLQLVGMADGFDRRDLYAVMNKPLRYIKREALQEEKGNFEMLCDYYKDNRYMINAIKKLEYDIHRMKDMDLFSCVNYIRKAIGYDDYLRQLAFDRKKEYTEYQKHADEIQERMKLFRSFEELNMHIEIYADQMQKKELQKNGKDVVIMTFHASKGLEFDTVYIPDCNEGIIPSNRSSSPQEIEEERRMLYVAATRAKNHLFLYYLGGEKKQKKNMISRFLSTKKEPYKMILF